MQIRVLYLVTAVPLLGTSLPAPAQTTPAPSFPLRDVVLFSSGVGYFGHAARVNGNATATMSFRAEQINDVLKSLVVFDPGGQVRPVTYTAQDSIARRLSAAGLSLNSTTTLSQLLRQFQGALVRLEVEKRDIEGRLVSISVQSVPVGKDNSLLQNVEFISVLTDKGLQSVRLDEVTRIQLLDARLEHELRESLALLASGLDQQRRQVQLRFSGNSAREVRAGYLREMPVWKTTYRLVLDNNENAKPYLQGWAIVENTTDDDWRDVRLSLVSGRPISFIQNLYQPLYVPRPVVAPQVIGSPLPQTYGEAVESERRPSRLPPGIGGFSGGGGFGGGRAGFGSGGESTAGPQGPQGPEGRIPSSPFGAADSDESAGRRQNMGLSAAQLAQGVAAQASGAVRGELFEYSIRQPVSVPQQQAAMVPILGENIGGEKVSIFDANSSADRALNGFRLVNSSGLHLSGGPITVFEGGVYAGDAQINDVGSGEDRLLSYAVDLDLVVSREEPSYSSEKVSILVRSGVLTITERQQRDLTYKFRNKAEEAKTVLVQQNIEPDFKLLSPAKPFEQTPQEYRFKVEVPAGQTVELKVTTERPVTETLALLDMDFDVLVGYSRNTSLSPKLRASLEQLVTRRRTITDLQAKIARLGNEIKEIDTDQSRIRQNMQVLDRNSDVYKMYLARLTTQETQLEKLRGELALSRDAEVEARTELRRFVDALNVE